MAHDPTATTTYASNRYAPRPAIGPVGHSLSPAQRELVAKLITERYSHIARLLATVVPSGQLTQAMIDEETARVTDPRNIVAAIQSELNRTDVRANGDQGLVSILLADNRAMAARVRESERKAHTTAAAAGRTAPAVEDGKSYRTPTGRVFHAYLTQRGILCVKEWNAEAGDLNEDGKPRGAFEYFGAATRMPRDAAEMSLEQAEQFGQATGTCAICMRHLTNDESVARGIGPVCAGKY